MTEWWRKPQRIVQTNLRLTDAAMDPRQVARDAKAFGATAMFFNVGGIFAWYPTKLPLQAVNPFLKDDLLGRMIEACRAEGIHFIGRYDLSKGTKIAYDAHPEWFCKTRDGKPFVYNGTYQASITGGWYHEQGPALLEETIRRYDIEAMFFNMFGYRQFSYSHEDFGVSHDNSAVLAFAEFSGGKAIPDTMDTADPVYREYLKFQDQTAAALGRKVYKNLIKSLNPRIGVANLAAYRDWIRLESNRSVVRRQPEWPYQTGERARFAQSVGRGERPYTIGITHFFDFPWRFTAESEGFQANRMAQALANGAEPHYYFLGTFQQDDEKPIAAMREAFAYHARHEALYSGLQSASRIGLYHSAATERYGHRFTPLDVHDQPAFAFHGAYRALVESGLAFDLVTDRLSADDALDAALRRYDVVVLPNVTCVSDREAAAIDSYVADGGAIVATGEPGFRDAFGDLRQSTALRSLPILGVREVRRNMRAAYFRIGDGEFDFPKTRLIMLDGPYLAVDPKPGAETFLRVQPPQRFGPPEFSYPEVPLSLDPGVIIGSHGQGRAAYLPWLPDLLFQQRSLVEHKQILAQVVGRFTRPLAKLQNASRVELTVRRHRQSGKLVVHIVNYSGQSNDSFEDPVVQHDLRLGVAGAGGSSALALVSGRTAVLGPADADGYRWIDVPPVKHMEAIVLEPA